MGETLPRHSCLDVCVCVCVCVLSSLLHVLVFLLLFVLRVLCVVQCVVWLCVAFVLCVVCGVCCDLLGCVRCEISLSKEHNYSGSNEEEERRGERKRVKGEREVRSALSC
jgi:hypothetical protein